jgi:multidrug transporter EmrE-like cation transporter
MSGVCFVAPFPSKGESQGPHNPQPRFSTEIYLLLIMSPQLFAFIILSVALNAMSHVLLRKAMLVVNTGPGISQDLAHLVIQVVANPFLMLGMSLYAVSIVIWLFVLSKVEVSVAYPFQSLGYIIAACLGFAFLGENLSVTRVFGIALTCAGLVFIARSA